MYSCDGLNFVLVDNLVGPSGSTGATGMAGGPGPSGATGAQGPADAPASQALWRRLALGSDVFVNDVAPACRVSRTGDISLRGHITLTPVPALGGMLLGILPINPDGSCPCSVDSGDIVGTTTGLAYSNVTGNALLPDVCIIRLLVSNTLRFDVNRDRVIDAQDVLLIRNNPQYVSDPNATSNCTSLVCGNVDVNLDGKVNQFDATAVTEAVSSLRFPLSVRCGGVVATAFSCGSTRSSPLVPAVGISLDTVSYFNSDGLSAKKKKQERSSSSSIMETLLSGVASRAEVEEALRRSASLASRDEVERAVQQMEAQRSAHSSAHALADVLAATAVAGALALLIAFLARRK